MMASVDVFSIGNTWVFDTDQDAGVDYLIRRAEPSDALEIAETYFEAKLASLPDLVTDRDRDIVFQTKRWRDYISEGSRAQHAKGDGYVYLAEIEGRVAGYVAWHSTSRHGVDAELQSLYVLRQCEPIGVGGGLLLHAAREVMARGLRSMCVGYDPVNPYKRFYFKSGAVEVSAHWAVWADVSVIQQSRAG